MWLDTENILQQIKPFSKTHVQHADTPTCLLLLAALDYRRRGGLEKLEDVLRTCASQIPFVKHLDYWQRLQSLKINSQHWRFKRYKILYTLKIIENISPNCGIEVYNEENTRNGWKCKTRGLKGSNKVRTLRESSFQCAGPQLFNALPKETRHLTYVSVD